MPRLLLRSGTASEWTAQNPILALGEIGYESDTKKLKIGDGTTAWNSLSYAQIGGFQNGDTLNGGTY